MPIYGYRCTQCGHELEVFQSMSDQPLRVCPECSGALRKLLYPVGVHFKGSGFYTTDYKSGAGSGSKNGSGASGESGSGEGSTDKKSESSSEKTAASAAPSTE
ncbi:MAG TPA: FmdB family zinc ribbon protein [Candidatus Dormibacteraeota bacterium]|nr:FmdB family zinc ribbon protein [Candidatus Dormibacteraeota bacterium]